MVTTGVHALGRPEGELYVDGARRRHRIAVHADHGELVASQCNVVLQRGAGVQDAEQHFLALANTQGIAVAECSGLLIE